MGTSPPTSRGRRERRMLFIYVLLLSGSSFVGCMAETEVLVVPLMDLLAGVRSPPSSAMEGRSVPLPVHVRKRDNGFSWTSFTNNMDILRGHLKEKIEVARRQADRVQSLGELGRK